MRRRTGLGHVDRVALHLEPRRDGVAEGHELGDLTVERHPEHSVEVPVGHQELPAVELERVEDARLDEEIEAGGRVSEVVGADVRDQGEAVRPVHAVDAVDLTGGEEGVAHEGDQRIRRAADEGDVHHAADPDQRWGQAGSERRDSAGGGVDPRDPAGRALGDVQRAAGAEGAARGALQSGHELLGGGGWRRHLGD